MLGSTGSTTMSLAAMSVQITVDVGPGRPTVDELKNDPRFSAYFPQDPPRIASTDLQKLRNNFAKIVSGDVVVVDQ